MFDVTLVNAVIGEERQHSVVGLCVAARVHVHRMTLNTCIAIPIPIQIPTSTEKETAQLL